MGRTEEQTIYFSVKHSEQKRKVRHTCRQRNASMKVTRTYDYNGSRIAVELFYCQRFYSLLHVSSSLSFAMNPIWPETLTVQQVTQWKQPPFTPSWDTLKVLCIFSDSSHFIFVSVLDRLIWRGEKEANASHNEYYPNCTDCIYKLFPP